MENCFCIQPFDGDKFDKRFDDVFEPAIRNAGLNAYRIDRDPSTKILIDDIEKAIRDSAICFAEITIDNPNVWYELGYAFSCGKDVVMVCSDERSVKFPFDIQHRSVVTYKTSSLSDFSELGTKITSKITAILHRADTVKTLNTTPVVSTKGLQGHEIALLMLAIENHFTSSDSTSAYFLKAQMEKSGYNGIATNVGLSSLSKMGYIEVLAAYDNQSQETYSAVRLTENGIGWILANQALLQYRKTETESQEK
jgi:hypothetical protein